MLHICNAVYTTSPLSVVLLSMVSLIHSLLPYENISWKTKKINNISFKLHTILSIINVTLSCSVPLKT